MAEQSHDCSSEVCRVLVVEDNPDLSGLLARLLTHHGHVTETTRNGTEALMVAATHKPHIALIDLGLPGLDGYYVAAQLRLVVPEALVIAVTGHGDDETVERCLGAGFDRHFLKPINFSVLFALLDEWKANSGCAA